jgi:hypothetical protein
VSPVRDRGEANALGLVLIAPAALALAVVILWVGRQVDTDAQMQAASSAAAQAAALQRSPGAAATAARSTVAAMLNDAKACAGGAVVSIDTAGFRPGGEVTVVVSCSPLRADLSLVGPPPATFSASATATIDLHRAAGLP